MAELTKDQAIKKLDDFFTVTENYINICDKFCEETGVAIISSTSVGDIMYNRIHMKSDNFKQLANLIGVEVVRKRFDDEYDEVWFMYKGKKFFAIEYRQVEHEET